MTPTATPTPRTQAQIEAPNSCYDGTWADFACTLETENAKLRGLLGEASALWDAQDGTAKLELMLEDEFTAIRAALAQGGGECLRGQKTLNERIAALEAEIAANKKNYFNLADAIAASSSSTEELCAIARQTRRDRDTLRAELQAAQMLIIGLKNQLRILKETVNK